MTSNAQAGARILGSLRSADGKGVVRMEDRFDTDIDDVWSALTDPLRLARWIGEVAGDLRLGGEYRYRFFASGSEGTGRVEACEPPRRLLLAHGLGQQHCPGRLRRHRRVPQGQDQQPGTDARSSRPEAARRPRHDRADSSRGPAAHRGDSPPRTTRPRGALVRLARSHQARARWFHHRARLTRDQDLTIKPLAS
jgi:uncharacterized protein YndB with AHSA1/START domain